MRPYTFVGIRIRIKNRRIKWYKFQRWILSVKLLRDEMMKRCGIVGHQTNLAIVYAEEKANVVVVETQKIPPQAPRCAVTVNGVENGIHVDGTTLIVFGVLQKQKHRRRSVAKRMLIVWME